MITTTPCDPSKVKIVLLKGGKSGEREISLKSGEACAKALREEGFEVVEIDTAQEGMLQDILNEQPDVVFIALHGKDGEDGCVQGLCELMNVPYTGPGVLASALAMDKVRAKIIYRDAGLNTADWVSISSGEQYNVAEIIELVGEKAVVKPDHEGSALGVHIVTGAQELEEAIEESLTHDSSVVVERFVEGIETTVAVIGNNEIEALPVIEIVPQGGSKFYDFTAKYALGGADHIIPARLDDEITLACQQTAMAAHKVLGCTCVSRTDIIVDEQGKPWVLETNTIPGMTATSLLPDAARAAGMSFPELCTKLIEFALE